MKSSFDTKLLYKYYKSISRSLVKNSPASLEAEGGVYSVPCLECSDKYYGDTIKSINIRISQHEYDVSRFKQCNAMYRHMFEKPLFYSLEKCIICLQ